MQRIETPVDVYLDRNGDALDGGYVFFGSEDENPITDPITVYWDVAGTQPAAQPLRTQGGYIVRNGTPAPVYANGVYSMLVQDSKRRQLLYFGSTASDAETLREDLADPAQGTDLIGWQLSATGTVAATLREALGWNALSILNFCSPAQRADILAGTVSIDCAAALQAAVTYANGRRPVEIPGMVRCDSQINCPTGTFLRGVARDFCGIYRTTNSHTGNTLVLGQDVPGLHAGPIRLENMWLYREPKFNPGNTNYNPGVSTSLIGRLTGAQAHLLIHECQRGLIDNVTFSNMPYDIILSGGAVTTIKGCHFIGSIWDQLNVNLQEGEAQIWFKRTAAGIAPTLINLQQNDFSGAYPSAVRSVPVGTNVANTQVENVGAKFAWKIDAVEGLSSLGDYFGGHNTHAIYAAPATGAICTNIKVSGGFFDGARLDCINLSHADAGGNVVLASFTDTIFNGETTAQRALTIEGTFNASSSYSVKFSDNICMAFLYSPVYIWGCVGFHANDNIISGYNCRGGNTDDPAGAAAIYVAGPYLDKIHIRSTQVGGAVNNLSSSNNCQWGVYFGGAITTRSAYDIINNGLGLSGVQPAALVVGSGGWGSTQAATLLNGWANFGLGYRNAGYYVDANRRVHFVGMIKSGPIGTLAFNLPVGMRPNGSVNLQTDSNGAFGRVVVDSSGTVTPNIGNNAYVALDGLSFMLDG